MPKPRGKGFEIITYVDEDLAVNKVTRNSRINCIIYLNQAPIYWLQGGKTALNPVLSVVNLSL